MNASRGRRRASSGVTLVELLVAVSLLSLLSVGMLMALHTGLNSMEKASAKLIANRRASAVQRILESEIAGFIPASADCPPPASAPQQVRLPFFEGGPDSMRFVSAYSLAEASRGVPRILEFRVIPGEKGRGVRLIVNEFPYDGPRSTGAACVGSVQDPDSGGSTLPRFRPIEIGPSSFVLADKLAYCRFEYRRMQPPPLMDSWLPAWRQPNWPTAIRVELAQIEADPSKVPLMGLTVPIYVNRNPNVPYPDSF